MNYEKELCLEDLRIWKLITSSSWSLSTLIIYIIILFVNIFFVKFSVSKVFLNLGFIFYQINMLESSI